MEDNRISTEKKPRVNDEIRAAEVRLIGDDGHQFGIVSVQEAKRIATEAGFDLVEVSPEADPPVCRIMDYGKYKFQLKKKTSKNTQKTQTKELKFRPGTEEADYQVKLRNLIKFIESGDKVKVTIRFRGRELSHPELGMRLVERMKKDLTDIAVVEQNSKFEGRQIVMVLGSKKK